MSQSENSAEEHADIEVDPLIGEMGQIHTTTRGGKMLCVLGYTYNLDKKTHVWRCTNRTRIPSCKATAKTTDDNKICETKHEHICQPDPAKAVKAKITADLKETASTSCAQSAKVYNDVCYKYNAEECDTLGKKKSVLQTIRRSKSTRAALKEPEDLDFEIPEEVKNMPDGSLFVVKDLKYVEKEKQKRIIIMTTTKLLTKLGEATVWILDGTFKVVPKQLYQLYIISGNIKNTQDYSQLLFVLLPGKVSIHSNFNSRNNIYVYFRKI